MTGPRGWGRRRGRQGGFTLVELMVALVVSSLLIGMILSIFTRMSMAYRAQQNVAELQQTLAAAQELIQRDVRQAGYQLPDGFRWAGATTTSLQPLQVVNNADGFGPDQLRVFHADASAQARVDPTATSLDVNQPLTSITVDDRDLFAPGDLIVMVVAKPDAAVLANNAKWLHYRACVTQIATIAGDTFALETAAPWGGANNDQCDQVRAWMSVGPPQVSAMVYRFSARAYRVDPDRRPLAVLQMSPSGALVPSDWQDLGVGFTDLQVATRWNDYWADQGGTPPKTNDTGDVDADPLLEWYSGEDQEALSAGITSDVDLVLYHRPVASEIRVSLVVRTMKKVDAAPTAATPLLTDTARVDNNALGDRAPVALAGVADAARPAELRGDAVFRHATIGADLRNMAVGQ